MTWTFTAHVPGELRFRDVVGVLVREVCQQVERDARCAGLEWRVVSAYNEAFNNIVEHAYGAREGAVEVRLVVDADQLVLSMVDEGGDFDYTRSGASAAPPLEGLDDGGMGLFIMRQSMSEVRYERRDDRNHLTMIKRLADCAPEGDHPPAATDTHGDGRC